MCRATPGTAARWNGRSGSPPPVFNFAVLPEVEGEEAYWGLKHRAAGQGMDEEPEYGPIEMPRNAPTGVVCAFFATTMGFGLIWHIWWMVLASMAGAFATFVVFAWRDRTEYEIPAAEVAAIDRQHRLARMAEPVAAE